MKHTIRTVEDLGLAIRATRKSEKLRQDDLAGTAQVSRQFAVNVEKGKPTVQMGLVLQLLEELGLELSVDLTVRAHAELHSMVRKRETSRSRPPRRQPE